MTELIEELRALCAIEGRPYTVAERARTMIAMSSAVAEIQAIRDEAWQAVPPPRNGRYLVFAPGNELREARWQSTKQRWTFPSAQSAFTPTHWRAMPAPPKGAEGDERP